MKLSAIAVSTAVLVISLASGCSNMRSARIQNNPSLMGQLEPHIQDLVRDGIVIPGYSGELVKIAMGEPTRVVPDPASAGAIEYWTYRNYVYGNSPAVAIGNADGIRRSTTTLISSSAPGGPSLSSTRAGPWQPVLSIDGDSIGTLYLKLERGRVVAAVVTRPYVSESGFSGFASSEHRPLPPVPVGVK